eukprot:3196610-Pleurochrysis_carterae.AAC.2
MATAALLRRARRCAERANFEPSSEVPIWDVSPGCRWVIGFCGWLVKRGWVKEVQLDMMLPGHTHEDIDAVFRCIYDYWKKRGVVLNPYEFKKMLRKACPGDTLL